MLIKTADFDYVEISQEDIISFPRGMYGFRDIKDFVLLRNPTNEWLFHLQSASGENPRFLLLDPYQFFSDYTPTLPDEAPDIFKGAESDRLAYFVVAVIPDNLRDMTVNLKSPVVIDFENKVGAQMILDNSDYGMRVRLFDRTERRKAEVQ